MNPGDKVILTENLEDLRAGMQGVVVKAVNEYPHTGVGGFEKPVLAVQFDHLKGPAITRAEKLIIKFCKKVSKKLVDQFPAHIEKPDVIIRPEVERLYVRLQIWYRNKHSKIWNAENPIQEMVWGNIEQARVKAQEMWKEYPGEMRQVFIYENVFYKPLMTANNFDKFIA